MDKKDAWVALFTKKPKKGTDLEEALSTIIEDTEPDADVDAALDDETRDTIGDFLMDPNAFIQMNASDDRKPFWTRMVPAPTVAPAAKPKAASKAKPVVASTVKSAPAPAPAHVVLPPRKVGLNPNAVAAAARASTAPVAARTLSIGNVSPSAVAPDANPATVLASAQALSRRAKTPPSIVATGVPVVPPLSTDPIDLTEQVIARLRAKGKGPSVHNCAQWRKGAVEAAHAKTQLEFEAAERQRISDEEAAERKRLRDEAAERQYRTDEEAREVSKQTREEKAAKRKRSSDEAAAKRKREKDDEYRKRQQEENLPKEEIERREALAKMRQITPVTRRILSDSFYKTASAECITLFANLRSADAQLQVKAKGNLSASLVYLKALKNGVSGPDRAVVACHLLEMIDELHNRADVTKPEWFHNKFITGTWVDKDPRTTLLR